MTEGTRTFSPYNLLQECEDTLPDYNKGMVFGHGFKAIGLAVGFKASVCTHAVPLIPPGGVSL